MKTIAAVLLAASVTLGGCYVVATPGGVSVGVPMPTMVVIPNTQVRIVQGYDDMLFYGNYYYRYHNGYWWRSTHWGSGWVVTTSVPRAFLHIPPTHPRYNLVRVHPQFRPPRVTAPRPQRPSKLDGKEEQQQQQQPSQRLPRSKLQQ